MLRSSKLLLHPVNGQASDCSGLAGNLVVVLVKKLRFANARQVNQEDVVSLFEEICCPTLASM